MNTPGRCTNTETCWVGNSGRTVHVLLGNDFVCPACNLPLRPPTLARVPGARAARRAGFMLGACALVAAAALGATQIPWAGIGAGAFAWVSRQGTNLAELWPSASPMPPHPAPRPAAPRDVALLGPAPAHFHTSSSPNGAGVATIGLERMASAASPAARPDRAPPDSGTHSWGSMLKTTNWVMNGRDWVSEGGTDQRPPVQNDPDTGRPGPHTVAASTARPNPAGDQLAARAPETIRPPSLFGRNGTDAESVPPPAQLDDLPVSAVEQTSEPDPAIYTESRLRRATRALAQQRHALPDALRVALSAQSEHVTLPLAAAPVLPRYPALFAQEYPAGRVSAVCLVAAAGDQPDCKVLGTGTSLSMTESVGVWPKAGAIHYRAIAANAKRAEAAWKPKAAHS
jgi:hypothetical protein